MICTVYWGGEGFVLVPDCIVASREAERRFGPLTFCGSLDTQGLSEDLTARIDQEIDERSFVRLNPDLALRLGYQPTRSLPLPHGFRWQEPDWWNSEELTLLCGRYPPIVVACVHPMGSKGYGWRTITNCHKPPEFRGSRISHTRAAAAQYVTIWACTHAHTIRAEILKVRH